MKPMDAIDNTISSTAAKADFAFHAAQQEQEIEQHQHDAQEQAQAIDQASQQNALIKPAFSEWDPWRIMVLRRP